MQILFNRLISSIADQLHQMGEVPLTNRQPLTLMQTRERVRAVESAEMLFSCGFFLHLLCYWNCLLHHVNLSLINPQTVLTVPNPIHLRSPMLYSFIKHSEYVKVWLLIVRG